jgi:hypothetical protein
MNLLGFAEQVLEPWPAFAFDDQARPSEMQNALAERESIL